MNIGFIGLGSMGLAMVPHLVTAGHTVSVWNRSPEAAKQLSGVTVLGSPNEAFQNDVVLTMLADDVAVRSVIIDSGALAAAREGCAHVMMATVSLALVEELVALHREAGIGYLSAPVFGVPAAAAQGQLNILAAGNPEVLAKVQPLFDVLGQKTWPLGAEAPRANIAKIAGNLMITLAIQAMGEATALTESYGLKAGDFLDIVTNTLFASPSYKRYGGKIASGDFEPGFKLTLGLKDVNLALEAGDAKQTVLPAAQSIRKSMLKAIDQGLGAKDWSVAATMAYPQASQK